MINLTVIAITLDEEEMLPSFIENVQKLTSNILIVDSFSNDRTKSICLSAGVNFIENKFEGFGNQWNFAINHELVRTDWVIKLDPDERLTSELIQSIQKFIMAPEYYKGAYFNRVLYFNNKNTGVEQKVVRLWKNGYCKFSNVVVNEHPVINGEIKRLKGILHHLDDTNINEWFKKQLLYSDLEAESILKDHQLSFEPRIFGSADQRRMYLKKVFFKVPFRYMIYRTYLITVNFKNVFKPGFIHWVDSREMVLKMIEFKIK